MTEQRCPVFLCCPVPGNITIHSTLQLDLLPETNIGPKLTIDHENAIARAMQKRRTTEISTSLRKGFPQEANPLTDDALHSLVCDVVQKMNRHQVRSIRHIHTFAAWQLMYGADFECRDPMGHAEQMLSSPLGEEQKMVRFKKLLDELHQAGCL